MTDIPSGSVARTTMDKVRGSLSRRHRKQFILQAMGITAISLAFLMLFILLASLISTGHKAFTQTEITLEVFIEPEEISAERLPRARRVEPLGLRVACNFGNLWCWTCSATFSSCKANACLAATHGSSARGDSEACVHSGCGDGPDDS